MSLSSQAAARSGRIETFERVDSQAIGDSPNDILRKGVNQDQLVIKHYLKEENGSLLSSGGGDRLDPET